MSELERRAAVLEVRARGSRLEGLCAVYGVEARIGSFREKIARGAFAGALEPTADVLALADHDPSRLLARTRSGTLRLTDDARGLAFSIDIPSTTVGADILALAERSDLGGMSIGFRSIGETWNDDLRVLTQVDLIEISVVSAHPAYSGTVVNARSRLPAPAFRLRLARRFMETV